MSLNYVCEIHNDEYKVRSVQLKRYICLMCAVEPEDNIDLLEAERAQESIALLNEMNNLRRARD